MDVTLQYFEDCPNWRETDRHLTALAAHNPDLVITHQIVDTPEQAKRVGSRGSPTVLIDGRDPFADPEAPVGLACRLYMTPSGPAGSPTLDQLHEALTSA